MLDVSGIGNLTREELVILMTVCMRPICKVQGHEQLPVELFEVYANGKEGGSGRHVVMGMWYTFCA